MQESAVSALEGVMPSSGPMEELEKNRAISTHVLVEEGKVTRLRELSKRTRVAQSEYLREAVDDLLEKYSKELP